ncbi:HIT family protein [Candidatus Falkowbacteria bacterium CG10_big_fil_rev_8_21_14_0_10_39_11]|uniref:HIT family protein n=1 Tax=Candidatus Falkowbacteria bacterium CG10_big_fil_rev_8_21_14_0_10_39_11 TaxID=1974565 RepID=A0A2H0V505_9BACT|nr:MAG: HIT family protein [Candidatus Falkowbacteria bacterium CG10_big_fil_rev_8_21_14_0_10_39_11]
MSNKLSCAFCDWDEIKDRVIRQSRHFFVVADKFPVVPGHILLVTKRHIVSFFELNEEEWINLQHLAKALISEMNGDLFPDGTTGFNIGINEGAAAGQTVPHLHIHFIPRSDGDVENTVGGIRNIFPNGDYTKDC